ncbi:hypothetical protein AAVH_24033 [Aphelenchoides avenae]|nr:hypothetical protein AAVH_24033 [Aphelenchus avenae]
METRSKKRLRLLNTPGNSGLSSNQDDNVPESTSKTSQKRQHAVEEAAACSTKRARKDAPFKLNMAGGKRMADKPLRVDLLLPVETLLDLLRLLPRDDLEGSQLVNRKFTRASRAIFKSGDVPPRKIERIMMSRSRHNSGTGSASVLCMLAKRSETDLGVTCSLHGLFAVEWLARVMRFSEVDEVDVAGPNELDLWGITSEIWHGLVNAFRGAVMDKLRFFRINFCPLAAEEVHRLKTLNVRTEVSTYCCHLLSNQITDAFLLNLSKMGVPTIKLDGCVPVDKATFQAGNDGALALCFPHVEPGQAERTRLVVHLPALALTEEFYAKFLEKCHQAPEDRPAVKCYFTPIPADAEPRIVALNPANRYDDEGDVGFYFHGAGSVSKIV